MIHTEVAIKPTTLNRYPHGSRNRHARVRSALADFSPAPSHDVPAGNDKDPSEEGSWLENWGGRYWVRTSDLFGVNEALSH